MAFSTIILVGGILLLLMHKKNPTSQGVQLIGGFLTGVGGSGIISYLVGGAHLMHLVVSLGVIAVIAGAWFIYSSRARRKQDSNSLG